MRHENGDGEVGAADLMTALAHGLDHMNRKEGSTRPWKIIESKRGEFAVMHTNTQKKFTVKIQERP